MSNSASQLIIFNVPLIAHISYLNDCQIKLPVLLREKDGKYFMKNPIKPLPSWQMDVIIRSIDLPTNHPIKFMKSPFGESDTWSSNILEKVGHSDFAEIYEITCPEYSNVDTGRRSPRVFCLAPVRCLIGESRVPVKSVCVDVSDTGFGLRFEEPVNLNIGDNCHIFFESPLSNLPEIGGKIVRQSTSALDRSTSVGVLLNPDLKKQIVKIIEFLVQRQSQLNTDSFTSTGAGSGSGLFISDNGFSAVENRTDAGLGFSRDIFTMFSQSGKQ